MAFASIGVDTVPCSRLIGAAGTGKTYRLKQAIVSDPTYAVLTATTGIAAINLGATTINSVLRYFDTDQIEDAYVQGRLISRIHEVGQRFRNIAIDESSMLEARQLDFIYKATLAANQYADVQNPTGLILVLDLAQLPPVKGDFCFAARCWHHFADNTERLEHVWRQDKGKFLDAVNLVRIGDGRAAADLLTESGIEWTTQQDREFEGTSILATNAEVRRFNENALEKVPGPEIVVTSNRWGEQLGEWGYNVKTKEWKIPPTSTFKIGAYVMLLANFSGLTYANGDCGHIVDYEEDSGTFTVKLVRNGAEVPVRKLVRNNEHREKPDGWPEDAVRISGMDDLESTYLGRPHFRGARRLYVNGQIEFHPMRLAYASTVHKTQSLTLDRVQIDFRNHFFNHPAMCYVAISRCRTLEGLRLVGQKETFASRVKLDKRVLPWL